MMSARWAEDDGSALLERVDVPETLTLEGYLKFSMPLINLYLNEKGLEVFLEEMTRALPEVFTFMNIVDEFKKKYVLKKDAIIFQIEYKDEEIILDDTRYNVENKDSFINVNQHREKKLFSQRKQALDSNNDEGLSENDDEFRPEGSYHRSRYYQTQPKRNRHILVTVRPQTDSGVTSDVSPSSYWKGYILMTEDPDSPNDVLLKLVNSTSDEEDIEWRDGLDKFSTWEEDEPSADCHSSYYDTETADDADSSKENNISHNTKRTFPRERRDHRSFHPRIQTSSASVVKIHKELDKSYKRFSPSPSDQDDGNMNELKRAVSLFDLTASTEQSGSYINYQPCEPQKISTGEEFTSESFLNNFDMSSNLSNCDDSEVESESSDTSLNTVILNPNFDAGKAISGKNSYFETGQSHDFDEENEDFGEENEDEYDHYWLKESDEYNSMNEEEDANWLEEEALATANQFDHRAYQQQSSNSPSGGDQPFIFKSKLDDTKLNKSVPEIKFDLTAVKSAFDLIKKPFQEEIVNEKDLTNGSVDTATKLFSSNLELLGEENSEDQTNDSKISSNVSTVVFVEHTRAKECCNQLGSEALANILISENESKVEDDAKISYLCKQPSNKVSLGIDEELSDENSKSNSGIIAESGRQCYICNYFKVLELNKQRVNDPSILKHGLGEVFEIDICTYHLPEYIPIKKTEKQSSESSSGNQDPSIENNEMKSLKSGEIIKLRNMGKCYVIHSDKKQLLHNELILFEKMSMLKRKTFRRMLRTVNVKLNNLTDCVANHATRIKRDLTSYQKETYRLQIKQSDSLDESDIITNIKQRYTSRTLCKHKHHLPAEKCIDKVYRKCSPTGNSVEVYHKINKRKDDAVYNQVMLTKRSIKKEKSHTETNERLQFFYYHKCVNIYKKLLNRRRKRHLSVVLLNEGLSSIPNCVNDPECALALIKYENFRFGGHNTQTLFVNKVINTIFKRNRVPRLKGRSLSTSHKIVYKFNTVKHKLKYRVLLTTKNLLSGWEIDKSVHEKGFMRKGYFGDTSSHKDKQQIFDIGKKIRYTITALIKSAYTGTSNWVNNLIFGKHGQMCTPPIEDNSTETSKGRTSFDLFSNEDNKMSFDARYNAGEVSIELPNKAESNLLEEHTHNSKSVCSKQDKALLINRYLNDCIKYFPQKFDELTTYEEWPYSQCIDDGTHSSDDGSSNYDDAETNDESDSIIDFNEVD